MVVAVLVTVGEATGDKVVRRLTPRVREIKLGPYTDSSSEVGPLVTPQQLEWVRSYVNLGGRGKRGLGGGRAGCDGGRAPGRRVAGGCLFDRVKADMQIYKKETFGAVLCVVRVDSYDDALQLVNEHEYGNGGGVHSRR